MLLIATVFLTGAAPSLLALQVLTGLRHSPRKPLGLDLWMKHPAKIFRGHFRSEPIRYRLLPAATNESNREHRSSSCPFAIRPAYVHAAIRRNKCLHCRAAAQGEIDEANAFAADSCELAYMMSPPGLALSRLHGSQARCRRTSVPALPGAIVTQVPFESIARSLFECGFAKKRRWSVYTVKCWSFD